MMNWTPALPGRCHPALAPYAEMVRTSREPMVLVPYRLGDDLLSQLQLTRYQAIHRGLMIDYGCWVWYVWVDHLGRQIAAEEATWVKDPLAFLLPEWNPCTR